MTWSPQLKVKVQHSLYRSGQALGLQEVETPRFHDSRHMEAVKLLPYTPAAFTLSGTHFC